MGKLPPLSTVVESEEWRRTLALHCRLFATFDVFSPSNAALLSLMFSRSRTIIPVAKR